MKLYLHPEIRSVFTAESIPLLFDQLMALKGECFRQQKGRFTQRIKLNGKVYFIKQHFGVGLRELWKNLITLRLPVLSARPEWLAIKRLKDLQIKTPNLVGFGMRGINPARLQSFLLMEALAPMISLEELTQTWQQNPPPFHFKRGLIKAVAEIARLLHAHGMNHRDFYLCHFLLDLSQGAAAFYSLPISLYLIDLHRVQIRDKVPRRWLIKDLAGLYFSSKGIGLTRHDYFYFIKTYSQAALQSIFSAKYRFWLKVQKQGERLYRDHHQ